MARGQEKKVGDTFVNANGYEYTKTADRGWLGTHVLVMEKHIDRRLRSNERVCFKVGKKPVIENLELRIRGDRKSTRARLAQVEARILDLQAEREELLGQLEEL